MDIRVLIDATGVTRNKAGVGVYAKNLIDQLVTLPNFHFFLLVQDDDVDLDHSCNANVTMLRMPSRYLRKFALRIAFEQVVLPFLLRKHRIQIVHSLHYSLPLVLLSRTRRVVTIHDMTFFSMPEVHVLIKKLYYRFFIRAATRRASALIFVSHSTYRDLVARLGKPVGLAVVIYHGKSRLFAPCSSEDRLRTVRSRYALPSRFVLYIGTIEPRKNLVRLVEAFASLAEEHPHVDLVIAGMKGWMYDALFTRVHELGLTTRVHFPGFVAEEDKHLLLCAAEIFIYPSLYEGFGLPVLEAMACGTPTITSSTSSLLEVAGDSALLISPTDVPGISGALNDLLRDERLRKKLSTSAVERASQFSWERTALETSRVYSEILSGNKSVT